MCTESRRLYIQLFKRATSVLAHKPGRHITRKSLSTSSSQGATRRKRVRPSFSPHVTRKSLNTSLSHEATQQKRVRPSLSPLPAAEASLAVTADDDPSRDQEEVVVGAGAARVYADCADVLGQDDKIGNVYSPN